MPDVKVTSFTTIDEKDRKFVRTTYSTPIGDLSEMAEVADFTSWTHEYLFKTPDDYKKLMYMIRNVSFIPDYDAAASKIASLGPDFIVRDQIPYEPLQALISRYMGTEAFSYEWMDNRDEVLQLYDALVESNRKTYSIVANGPMQFANYGGNVTPSVIGPEVFRQYYVPNYNEAADILHGRSKLIGTHLDADNSLIMDDVSITALDYIEAYDVGMSPSVRTAKKSWLGKALWINWPSVWHLNDSKVVREKTRQLIEDAKPCDGFIIGITEDVPVDRWQQNFMSIMDGIDDCIL